MSDEISTCYCGHSVLFHGECDCSRPTPCAHVGKCDLCGCTIFEEAR